MPQTQMAEVRCKKCKKLLGYLTPPFQTKCPRCGELNKAGDASG